MPRKKKKRKTVDEELDDGIRARLGNKGVVGREVNRRGALAQ